MPNNPPENLDKIVEQCILMEIQAMSLYTTLANRVTDEETSRMLRYLAEMEESHVTRLVEIFSGVMENANKALSRVDIVKTFQSEAWRMHKARLTGAGLTETSPLDDYLTFAIVAESHARSHYDRLSAEAGDAKAKEIFRILSREEGDHETHLKKIQTSLRESR
ncbi:MAG: ferritin family protein [Candidatus Deferrimicrobiaceae bacterium]